MSGTTITQAFVQQWDTSLRAELAQKESRLMKAVTDRGTIVGESFTITNLDDDGSILPLNTVRHGDTQWSDDIFITAVVTMKDYFDAKPLDRNDIPKMINNPVTGGDYMAKMVAKRNRTVDYLIYRAARDSQLKKDGTSEVLPSTQKIAHSSTGFTKAKLITARKIFRANECDEHNGEELYIMYTADMLEDILSDTTLTSADFMAVRMLQSGAIDGKWMGFNWVPFEGIDPVSSSTYYTVAWAKSGIHLGKGFEEGDVGPRRDKKNLTQVSLAASYGAGRQQAKKVVEIAYQ
jgi:hypothetical protein